MIRKPYQGVYNIIRFNWHFYVLALIFVFTGLLSGITVLNSFRTYTIIVCCLTMATTIASLVISYYIYDLSGLYKLNWLDNFITEHPSSIMNIHAGFDETSALLLEKFPNVQLRVFDFYDPKQHTEVSIRRARKAYVAFAGTENISTMHLPAASDCADVIFLMFSVHEIRNEVERIAFMSELKRIMKPDGKIWVTEHLRDFPNFLAYNIGFFHFFSKRSWYSTFASAGLIVQSEKKVTPFVTSFILVK